MLYACLYIPDFPAAVLLRGERNLRVPPLVVYTGAAPNCFVYAATQPARSAGIKEGMPLTEATARFAASRMAKPSQQPSQRKKSSSSDSGRGRGIRPYRLRPTTPPQITVGTGTLAGPATVQPPNETTAQPLNRSTAQRTLQTLARNPEAEQQTQQELLELALTVSPRVEDTAPGVIVVELDGLRDPHGSAASFSHEAEKLGLPANVAVSQNRFVALCGAKTRSGVTHIFPGQEAGFLHPLAIDVLPLDSREKETLGRWGIRTVGELARLPEDSLVARFGTRGARLAKLAHGQEDSVLRPYEPVPAFEEKMDFEWQIAELEPLAFLLSGLLDNLCSKLQGLGLAARADSGFAEADRRLPFRTRCGAAFSAGRCTSLADFAEAGLGRSSAWRSDRRSQGLGAAIAAANGAVFFAGTGRAQAGKTGRDAGPAVQPGWKRPRWGSGGGG